MTDLKIDLFILHWNEEKICKFMIDYWKKLPIRKFFVIDNESTDNSLNILKEEFKDKLEIIPNKSENTFNDYNHMNFKNNIWKDLSRNKVDFVIVSDFDEQIWHPNLLEQLQIMKENQISIVNPIGIEIFFEQFPTYDSSKLLHQYENVKLNYAGRGGKCILFNPNLIDEINYDADAHHCFPTGQIKWNQEKFFFFHSKNLSADYLVQRNQSLAKRLSEINLQLKWGIHYLVEEEKMRAEFKQKIEKCVDNLDILIK